MTKLHESVVFKEGGDGPIDAEMIPLVNELNRAGLQTTQCCSGHKDGRAYLSIALNGDVEVVVYQDRPGGRVVLWWNPTEDFPEARKAPIR